MASRIREVLSNRRARRFVGVGSAVVLAGTLGVISYVSAAPGPVSMFVPLSPIRILDTRPAPDGPIGVTTAGPLVGVNGACTRLDLKVAGVNGIPDAATAVVLNLTATSPNETSFLKVYPAGGEVPAKASNLNWVANRTIANLATVQVGTEGRISFCNYNGTVDVIVDIAGYYVQSTGGPFDATLYYSKAELDGAGVPGRYTKAQTDALLAAKADAAATTAALVLKADASAMTTALAAKADTTALTAGLAAKADTTAIATMISAIAAPSAGTPVTATGAGIATTATHSCSGTNRKLLSGGGAVSGDAVLISSYPSSATTWTVTFTSAAGTGGATAYVICATAP